MSDCPFKSGRIPGGWDIAGAFEMPTLSSAHPAATQRSRPRPTWRTTTLGPFPEAGVLPSVPAGHPLRLHRAVGGFSGRNAAAPLPRPRASQPDSRVGEQQHPARGEKRRRRRRRSGAQPMLQIQTHRRAGLLREGLAAGWCELVNRGNRGLFGWMAVWWEHLRVNGRVWGWWRRAHLPARSFPTGLL